METKHVYELNFKVNGYWHNLLYSSFRRAQRDLINEYFEGNKHASGVIESSHITERVLF